MTLLFRVEDVFDISGRGCVLVPAIPNGLDFKIKPSDQIQLRTPDGRVLDSRIASVEFLYGKNEDGNKHCRMAIMLPNGIVKEEVPKGTEVWIL
jgi:translation elongation factor EF-Tu-like GTPase